jgi:hypothetical protein
MRNKHPEARPRLPWLKYAGLAVLVVVTGVVVFLAVTRY